jgi:hypothetical protein
MNDCFQLFPAYFRGLMKHNWGNRNCSGDFIAIIAKNEYAPCEPPIIARDAANKRAKTGKRVLEYYR